MMWLKATIYAGINFAKAYNDTKYNSIINIIHPM